MKELSIFLAWMFMFDVVFYLFFLIKLVVRIRNERLSYWKDMGGPSLFDSRGQKVILREVIFSSRGGNKELLPYANGIMLVRCLFISGLICFAAIVIIVFGDMFGLWSLK